MPLMALRTPLILRRPQSGRLEGRTGAVGAVPALELRGVRRVFRLAGTELRVLNGVDLEVRPGEIVALVCPSGTGNSTLLHVAGLLDRPDGGARRIGGGDSGNLLHEPRTFRRRPQT